MPGIVLGALHILLNPCKQTCDKYVDSKQIDCQLFLWQKSLFQVSKELQLGIYSRSKPHASLQQKKKGENSFIEVEKKLGGL